jgi:CDGSH iron-sulfur domain-containing protein 3
MSAPDPRVAQRAPFALDLAPGEYGWCACGQSRQQPFCDGSHRGGPFAPVRFTVTARSGTLWLCGCKHSRRPPFCDGTHNKLEQRDT